MKRFFIYIIILIVIVGIFLLLVKGIVSVLGPSFEQLVSKKNIDQNTAIY